jgi:hypothetical protein
MLVRSLIDDDYKVVVMAMVFSLYLDWIRSLSPRSLLALIKEVRSQVSVSKSVMVP